MAENSHKYLWHTSNDSYQLLTIEIANNVGQHNWTNHVEFDKNYINDNLDFGRIKIPYNEYADQVALWLLMLFLVGHLYNTKLGMCDIYKQQVQQDS